MGKGGIAVTYGAVNLPTKSNVAIKVIFLKQLNDWKQIELFKRKAEVLTKLKHTAIPKYIDYFALETNRIKIFSDRRDLIFFQFLAYLATIA